MHLMTREDAHDRRHVPLIFSVRGPPFQHPAHAPIAAARPGRVVPEYNEHGDGRAIQLEPNRSARLLRLARLPQTLRPVSRRSEEHTSELQSLMRISYAVFCLKKKKQ